MFEWRGWFTMFKISIKLFNNVPLHLPLYLRPISGVSPCSTTTCKHRMAVLNRSGMGLRTYFNWAVYSKDYFSPVFKRPEKKYKNIFKRKQIRFKSALVQPLCASCLSVFYKRVPLEVGRACRKGIPGGKFLMGALWAHVIPDKPCMWWGWDFFFFLYSWLVLKSHRFLHSWE